MINEKIGGGVTSSTPTDINVNTSLHNQSFIQKIGHVVTFRILLNVDTAMSGLTWNFVMCKLPYAPAMTSLTAVTRYDYSRKAVGMGWINSAGQILWGEGGGNPSTMAAGSQVSYSGTYIAKD